MKIIQPSAVPAEPATSPLFTGEVSRQPILTPEMSQHFNLGIVTSPRVCAIKCTPIVVIRCCL